MSCRHRSCSHSSIALTDEGLAGLAFGGAFTSPNPERHYAPDLGIEPRHREIDLRIDLKAQCASGTVTTTAVVRREGAVELRLDATDFLDVSVVSCDGLAIDWHYDGLVITVRWTEAPAVGTELRIATTYRVERPLTGMIFSGPDAAYPERPLFMATDHETERARFWLPCVDHPSVRTTLGIHLRAKSELTVLANGIETGRDEHSDGTTTVHWSLEQACPAYLVCMAVGDFIRVDGGTHEGLEVAFFTTSNFDSDDLRRSFEKTRSMLDWMTQRLSTPFPFPKYFQLAVSGVGGAMENISLVTWDDKFVADQALYAEWGWLIDLINVHEMAHSYFGDSVVSRDFAHVWLKESWATYMESCWLGDTAGTDEMAWQLSEESRSYRGEADSRYVRPIVTREFDSSWDMYDQHLYPGGAFRLHMLRCELGDADFWGGVSDYLADYSGKVVETADFRRSLEDRSGRSLARFFDQWFHSPGYPKLKAGFKWDGDRNEAILTVEQKQVDAKKKVGLFDLALEVDFEGADGVWTRAVLQVSSEKQALVVGLPGRPRQIVIDPRGKVLHSLDFAPGHKMLEHTLLEGQTVPARVHAARSLSKIGSRVATASLLGAYATEPNWGVRIAIVRALATAGSQGAALGLASLLASEEDPRVLPELLGNLGAYRDPAMADALCKWLDSGAPGPLARSRALTSLGKQRGTDHLDRLCSEAETDGWWGWGMRGALTGLGQTRTEGARSYLAGRVSYGDGPVQVRMAAAEALAEAGRWQELGARQETLETLSDLVRAPEYSLRVATSRALRRLGMPEAIAALEATAQSLAPQDRPRIQRSIAGLRRQLKAGGTVPALRKQVEELSEKMRKLADRVDGLEARDES